MRHDCKHKWEVFTFYPGEHSSCAACRKTDIGYEYAQCKKCLIRICLDCMTTESPTDPDINSLIEDVLKDFNK